MSLLIPAFLAQHRGDDTETKKNDSYMYNKNFNNKQSLSMYFSSLGTKFSRGLSCYR